MSIMTVAGAMDRIKGAAPSSPIAVFKVRDGSTNVNVVFANTVESSKVCSGGSGNLIGIYHQRMNREQVRSEIITALREGVGIAS